MEIRWQPTQPFLGSLRYHISPMRDSGISGWDEFSLEPATAGKHQHSADRTVRPAAFRQGRLVTLLSDPPKALMVGLSPTEANWYRIDLVCWGDMIVHCVSGTVVSTQVRAKPATGQEFTRGRIEICAGRGSIDVRRIEIRSVAGIPTEFQSRDE